MAILPRLTSCRHGICNSGRSKYRLRHRVKSPAHSLCVTKTLCDVETSQYVFGVHKAAVVYQWFSQYFLDLFYLIYFRCMYIQCRSMCSQNHQLPSYVSRITDLPTIQAGQNIVDLHNTSLDTREHRTKLAYQYGKGLY